MRDDSPSRPDREAAAVAEMAATRLSPGLARVLVASFLAAILSAPVVQHIRDFRDWRAGRRSEPAPQAWEILPDIVATVRSREERAGAMARAARANRRLKELFDRYERRLEEESWMTGAILPGAQWVLSRVLGVGNEKTYLGRGPWLFYRPDVEYLTGPGFLSPGPAADRTADGGAAGAAHAGPVEAILHFHAQLAARDIALLVLPVPGKASLHPDRFASAFHGATPVLQNAAHGDWLRALRAAGVRVFDTTAALAAFARESGEATFLATDTHWTPAAMEHVARQVAAAILPLLPDAPREPPAWRAEETRLSNLGDLGVMLRLPPGAGWPPHDGVALHPVAHAQDGSPWRPDPDAEVLLLGDSFSNIYSMESMGWGTSAGLPEHISLALNRNLDALRRNDAGAYVTRAMLARDLAQGRDRLRNKSVVIWQFAERELVQGDWRSIEIGLPRPPAPRLTGPAGLRRLAGARCRAVWIQAADPESANPFGTGTGYALVGLDTDDGMGERQIIAPPIACRRPLFTPDGDQVVFTDFPRGEVMAVRWDGSELRELAPGFAAAVWRDPSTARTWVYAIEGPMPPDRGSGQPMVRFELDRPSVREPVWTRTEVALDNFQLSADGTRAGGLFPWPHAGIADLREGSWARIGRGCWSGLAPDNSYIACFFDGAHRNLILEDPAARDSWSVPLHVAPGIEGYEVFHPRWSNHPRFFVMTGPYKSGEGRDRISAGGGEVEVHAGRFSERLRRVERWAQVTANARADFYPDLWIDPATPPAFDPADVEAADAMTPAHDLGPVEIEARLTAVTRVPSLASIAPYRQALVVYAYDVVKVLRGSDPGPHVLVHHWGITGERVTAPAHRIGATVALRLDPFDDHPELQGERVISDIADAGWPLFYEPRP